MGHPTMSERGAGEYNRMSQLLCPVAAHSRPLHPSARSWRNPNLRRPPVRSQHPTQPCAAPDARQTPHQTQIRPTPRWCLVTERRVRPFIVVVPTYSLSRWSRRIVPITMNLSRHSTLGNRRSYCPDHLSESLVINLTRVRGLWSRKSMIEHRPRAASCCSLTDDVEKLLFHLHGAKVSTDPR